LVLFKTKNNKKATTKLNDSIAALENMNNQFKEEE
jgi:hypothetical protein